MELTLLRSGRSMSALVSSLALGGLVGCAGGGIASSTPPTPALGTSTAYPAASAALSRFARDLGRHDPNKPITIGVLLRYNHAAELDRFVDNLARARHPRYLTHAEFVGRYAPTQAQEERVVGALRAAGFTVTQRFANRQLVDATAPSAMVERFFGTEIHDFQQPKHGVRWANVRAMRIPAMLAPDVSGVNASSFALVRFESTRSKGAPTPSPDPGLGPAGGWGPSPVAKGLAMPVVQGYGGQGQTVAVVDEARMDPVDLRAYLHHFKIHATGKLVNEAVDGGAYSDHDIETSLDVETIAGLAPNATVIDYDSEELTLQTVLDAYNQIVSDGKATVISSSFGICEIFDSSAVLTDELAEGAAAQGITFAASAGDVGASCPDYSIAMVSSPASNPHFVGVGGTLGGTQPTVRAPLSGPIANPTVWNDELGAGGGGISVVFPEPSYQAGVTGASAAGRNVPDIALPAPRVSVYDSGWLNVWGTSWASPIYAAMQAEINEMCGAPQWGINVLYNAFAKSGYQTDFLDVVKGNNTVSIDGTTVQGYNALPGFDNVSGIGIPFGVPIANDTCP